MIEGWREIDGEGSRERPGWQKHNWDSTSTTQFERTAQTLYKSKLVRRKEHKDGSITLTLTDEGRKYALRYHLETLSVKRPKKWDGKWRVVMYDIPEGMRRLRGELRHVLRSLGFVEVQKSVFAHPYECRDEIEFLIEAYNARAYVRRMVVEEIDICEPLTRAFAAQAQHAAQQTEHKYKKRKR